MKFTWHMYKTRRIGDVKLSKQQAEILFIIAVRREVAISEIIEFLWPNPDDEPDWPYEVITQQMSKLRRKLGANFCNGKYSWGYSLA